MKMAIGGRVTDFCYVVHNLVYCVKTAIVFNLSTFPTHHHKKKPLANARCYTCTRVDHVHTFQAVLSFLYHHVLGCLSEAHTRIDTFAGTRMHEYRIVFNAHNFRGSAFSKILQKQFSRIKDSISINTVF